MDAGQDLFENDFVNYDYGAAGKFHRALGKPRPLTNMISTTFMCLVVPWLLFVGVFALMSYSLFYYSPSLCWLIFAVLIGLACVLTVFLLVQLKKAADHGGAKPLWLTFACVSIIVALLSGVGAGHYNFIHAMRPYYDVLRLNTYTSVDPSTTKGQQMMDAGQIRFTNSTSVDLTRAMGFKNKHMYCVAPITSVADPSVAPGTGTYDFWAVGLDCCSGHATDFACNEVTNLDAKSGLRLMRDDQRAFYRLAVEQAKAAFNIQATHPVFFLWMQDPTTEIDAFAADGARFFIMAAFAYLAFQLLLLVIGVVVISKRVL